jgi:hypothetical protein
LPANKNKLRVVSGDEPVADPLRKLDKHGRKLWDAVMSEYSIPDSGGLEMLTQACLALGRAERCREAIDADGEMIRSKGGHREHPLLKHELAARSFVVRTLQRLNLDAEAIKAPGRPPSPHGWLPDADN